MLQELTWKEKLNLACNRGKCRKRELILIKYHLTLVENPFRDPGIDLFSCSCKRWSGGIQLQLLAGISIAPILLRQDPTQQLDVSAPGVWLQNCHVDIEEGDKKGNIKSRVHDQVIRDINKTLCRWCALGSTSRGLEV